MADNYSRARATKEVSERDVPEVSMKKSQKKRIGKKIIKSPLLIIIAISLIVGLAAGYFAAAKLNKFEMNQYLVNGVESEEIDYVVVDMTATKEKLEEKGSATMSAVVEATTLEDEGVTCKLLGIDVSKSVSKEYYYREDISYEATKVEEIDLNTPGVYYIVYKSSNFAFKKTTLIRTIVVLGVENDG